jgi:hypothetical protein
MIEVSVRSIYDVFSRFDKEDSGLFLLNHIFSFGIKSNFYYAVLCDVFVRFIEF